MASLILVLPEQFERRRNLDLPSGRLFLGRTIGALARNFAQAEKDAQQWISWIKSPQARLHNLDSRRIGITGISLGGILSSLLIAKHEDIKAGVLLLAGADPASIILESSLTQKLARESGESPDEIRHVLKPFNLLEREPLSRPPVLIVEAIWDSIIPANAREKLRRAFPRARTIRMPSGHITAALHLFWVKGRVARFFAENLK